MSAGADPLRTIAARIATAATAKTTTAPPRQAPTAPSPPPRGDRSGQAATTTAPIASSSSAIRSRTQPMLRSRAISTTGSATKPATTGQHSHLRDRSGSNVSPPASPTAALASAGGAWQGQYRLGEDEAGDDRPAQPPP